VLDRYVFGAIEVRAIERAVLRDGAPQRVGARAFDLLIALIERGGALVTKDELLDAVWPGLVVEEANVQVQVSSLRKLLGARAIATVPGLGYRFAMAPADAAIDTDAAIGVDGDAMPEPRAAEPVPRGHNLPEPLDALVGRAADIDALAGWVAEHHLVTVHGPGGIGKTRVAQAVARDLRGRYANGVWWVDLAALDGPHHLVAAIANAAGLSLGSGSTDTADALLAALTAALGPRELVLVLDNCEPLVDAVGRFALAVRRSAPGVRLLVTSQERLKVAGEMVYRLEPLATPAPRRVVDLPAARAYAAVELLEQRARAADRRFVLDEHNLDAALALVRRLDGIPLAIEMAAARIPLLGLPELVRRLDHDLRDLRLLRKPERGGVPARQQTLQATLEWSHALLDADEQAALARLAVFAGSFRVEAAQHVAASVDVDEWAVLDLLAALIDKSLVQLERGEPPRYRLLETMRLFALARLAESGGTRAAERRHGEAMAELAAAIEASFWQLGDRAWLARYAADYDDLQLAFDRACARGDAEVAAHAGNALSRLDTLRNLHPPRKRRAEALHALLPQASTQASAWIWNCIASLQLIELDAVPRLQASAAGVAAWRQVVDPENLYVALGYHAAECARTRDFGAVEQVLAEMRALEDPAWPLRRRMWGAGATAGVCIHRGDAQGYRQAGRIELELAEQAGAERTAAWARLKLADAALMAGDHAEAIVLGYAAAAELRSLDQPANLGLALSNLCEALLFAGRDDQAWRAAREALPLLWRSGWGYLLLDSITWLALQHGRHEPAARLLGYTSARYRARGDQRQPNEAEIARRVEPALSEALGAARLAALQDEGAALDDARAQALADELVNDVPDAD